MTLSTTLTGQQIYEMLRDRGFVLIGIAILVLLALLGWWRGAPESDDLQQRLEKSAGDHMRLPPERSKERKP